MDPPPGAVGRKDDDDTLVANAQTHQSRASKSSALDRRQYADAIDKYSKLEINASLYPGVHFENLAAYIRRPLEARHGSHSSLASDAAGDRSFAFVTLRDLDPSVDAANRVRHFNKEDDFQSIALNLASSRHGHIVFMRGHPSPEWLLTIGQIYQLDPEFFRQHLDFRPDRKNYFLSPSLPSASTLIARLTATTLGNVLQSSVDSSDAQTWLRDLQDGNREAMDNYRRKITDLSASNTGDSILRDCSIHNARSFSLEQDISLHTCKTQNSWAAFVWLDHGNDLSTGRTAWLTSTHSHLSTTYLPTIQYKRDIALKQRDRLLAPLHQKDRLRMYSPQSASLLHLDYGRRLNVEVAAMDSFYAMHEIYRFVAFSEVQWLNMLQAVLKEELAQSRLARYSNPTLSNLLYQREILERHSQRLRHTIDTIRDRSPDSWPSDVSTASGKAIANAAAESLIRDFQNLFDRCQNLLQQCSQGTQIVAHNATIKESREAIRQAEEVAKLTQLAFFFIPLTFVTSIFGMNCKGLDKLELWVWVVVSIPVFVVSLILLKYDLQVTWDRFCEWIKKKWQR